MTHRPIMDAGPGLNFLSINQERLLLEVTGLLAVPETVEQEILRKARRDQRFRAASHVWAKITPHYVTVLSDEFTPELAEAVHRMENMPLEERLRSGKDLGEVMVTAHAAIAAEAGDDVLILMDDAQGRRRVKREQERLDRLRRRFPQIGTIRLLSTRTVLEAACRRGIIPDKAALQKLYQRLRELDDGLPPIKNTALLRLPCWD